MGNRLFGIDIAGIIGRAVSGGLLPATLHSVVSGTRGANLTAGTQPTTTDHAARGIVEDFREHQIDGTRVRVGDKKVLLIGNSIAGGKVPKTDDHVTIEGVRYVVVDVRRDPAAAAYVLHGRTGP